ncbi:putative nuclease HARBI1 [Engraulis encrasicolus]|uniref:putative nuclease HARBI1 n=1 Tax=Engraulis encrasicolus TaxID=184585 RepID=UPI002FCFE99A
MACPFLNEDIVDEGANIVHRALIPPVPRVFRNRNDPLAASDDYLYGRYRFSQQGLVYLTNLLDPYIAKYTRRSRALSSVQSVCIGLRFFASGTFLYTIGDAEGLAKATVCREIRKVYLALKAHMNFFITFPGHLPEQRIKEAFFSVAGFPNVLGAIDCTHVKIIAPPGPEERDYINRKRFHSLNIQMICDTSFLITNIEARWPGSAHDALIYKGLRVTPRRACDIRVACAVLHNIANLRKERMPLVEMEEQWDQIVPAALHGADGRRVRDAYRNRYF